MPDFIDHDISKAHICSLADNFEVAFKIGSHLSGEMIFFQTVEPSGLHPRSHNNSRPVKGHRPLIKEVYFDGEMDQSEKPLEE